MEVCVELLIIKKTPQLAKNNAWTDALKNFGVFWGRSLKDVCTVLHPLPEGRPMPETCAAVPMKHCAGLRVCGSKRASAHALSASC